MGSASVQALNAADDVDVAAEVDAGDSLDELTRQHVRVALDFTQPQVAIEHVQWCIDQQINIVVGTSGFSQDRLEQVQNWLGSEPRSSVLIVPNFSVGAALMMQLAARAAPWFESVEIIEMHHPDKVDAPSGTATRTAETIADARAGAAPSPDATASDPDGARGASIAGIGVHALRVRGFTASQQVQFGGSGELFELRHDSVDRTSFMPGVVAAMRAMGAAHAPAGLSVGLESVLEL